MRAEPTRQQSGRKGIFLVEDHPLMREGIAKWVEQEPDLKVCGHAASVAQALAAIQALRPNLVLVDIGLPGRSGLELIKDLHASEPKLPVVVFSMHDESLYARRAMSAGARGYVMKNVGGDELVGCIRKALEGQMSYSPEFTTRVLEGLSAGRRKAALPSPDLTDRELEIFHLIGELKTTREIGKVLHLSVKTVATHRANIKHKLKINTSAELMRFAIEHVSHEALRQRR